MSEVMFEKMETPMEQFVSSNENPIIHITTYKLNGQN